MGYIDVELAKLGSAEFQRMRRAKDRSDERGRRLRGTLLALGVVLTLVLVAVLA